MDNTIEVKIGDRLFWIDIPSDREHRSFDGNIHIKSGILTDAKKIDDSQSELTIDSPDGTVTRIHPLLHNPTFARESDAIKVARNTLDYWHQRYTDCIKYNKKYIINNEIRLKDLDKAIDRFNRRYA